MKKIYIAITLVVLFLAAMVLDWNTQQESAQRLESASMIIPRDDDILELEIGHPSGRNPAPPEEEPAQGNLTRREERIPSKRNDRESAAKLPASPPQVPTSDFYIYTVKEGDTVSEIAQKWLQTSTRADEIIRLNGIDDPRKIKPGMKLKIPKK